MKLDTGEFICPKCYGRGRKVIYKLFTDVCPKCNGLGKLDWISNIMVPKKRIYSYRTKDTGPR